MNKQEIAYAKKVRAAVIRLKRESALEDSMTAKERGDPFQFVYSDTLHVPHQTGSGLITLHLN